MLCFVGWDAIRIGEWIMGLGVPSKVGNAFASFAVDGATLAQVYGIIIPTIHLNRQRLNFEIGIFQIVAGNDYEALSELGVKSGLMRNKIIGNWKRILHEAALGSSILAQTLMTSC